MSRLLRPLSVLLPVLLTAPAHAQMPEKGSYAQCDAHIVKSTVCVFFVKDDAGRNFSQLTLREENDTGGLTYLSLECNGQGSMAVYVQAKHALLTQADFDAEVFPTVSYRQDNGPLKAMTTYGAHEADAQGEPVADLNALGLLDGPLQALASNGRRFQLVIPRNGFSTLTYNFPVYGLELGIQALNYCKPQ